MAEVLPWGGALQKQSINGRGPLIVTEMATLIQNKEGGSPSVAGGTVRSQKVDAAHKELTLQWYNQIEGGLAGMASISGSDEMIIIYGDGVIDIICGAL